jgi:catechol 2,3-dioxygenase-like lactoylglutathione lyase family enzyme
MPHRPPGPFDFQLHHMQLSIPQGSEEACRRFYVGVLGFTEVPKPPALAARGGLWLRSGDVELHLGVEGDFRPAKKAHPALRTPRFDELVAHLGQANVPLRWDEAIAGQRRFFVDDNLGNRLEFMEAPGR